MEQHWEQHLHRTQAAVDPPVVPATSLKPECPRCGWRNTRLSRNRTVLDAVLRIVGLRAFRCRACGRRFHVFSRRTSAV